MSYLMLAAVAWGLLFATFVGLFIHGNRKWRAARDFNDHTLGVLAILREPTCPACHYVVVGPPSEHVCDWQ